MPLTFGQSMKVVISGACAVVIGLAWKDYIMDLIDKMHPVIVSKIGINPHILSFVFIVALTLILGFVIHRQNFGD